MSAINLRILALITLLLLIAAGLRLHELGTQSFWYDEGVAYGHSQRNLAELIPALQRNVHVPAYFASLAFYEDFVGNSEFALRSLSVWLSVLSVAGAYALSKRLYGNIAALATAAIVTFNSFSIYYAQETRMYAMLAAVAALSMWHFVGFMRITSREDSSLETIAKWSIGLALLNIIGEYTHVSYALVMLSQGLLALLWLGSLVKTAFQADSAQGFGRFATVFRAFVAYTLANLVTVLFFLPWLGTALGQVGSQPNISDQLTLDQMLPLYFGRLSFGITFEASMGGMGTVMLFLLIFALLNFRKNDKPFAVWNLLLPFVWLAVSVGLYHYLELYDRYFRFILPAQIAFAVCLGRGIFALWQIVPRREREGAIGVFQRNLPKFTALFATFALCFAMISGLSAVYAPQAAPLFPQNFIRDDYRALAQMIENESLPEDAIILSAQGLQEIFGYYYKGDLPVYPLPSGENTVADVEQIIRNHRRIYVVLYGAAEQDPEGLVSNTLNQHAYQINAEWIDRVQLVRYASPVSFANFTDVNLRFGEHITLERYALSSDTLQANDALQVQFQWKTDALLATRYKVFIQLLNEAGEVVTQRDSEPAGGQALTPLWLVGESVADKHALSIPNLPAGDYRLIIGLYEAEAPYTRLAVGTSDYYELARFRVE